MSVQAMAWVLENSKSELGARLVLLSIANHAKSDGTGAWPSVKTLAKESHMGERQVRYCLRKLEGSGELQTQIKAGPYGTNTYSLPLMVGANIAPPGAVSDIRRGILRPLEGHSIAPEPSLTVHKDKELILRAIEESEKTGVSADDILARLRA